MKTSEEILARARGLLCAELDRRLLEASQRLPHLCMHNHRQPVETRPDEHRIGLPVIASSSTIGLCMLNSENPEAWQGTICEDPIDAKRCPFFTATQSKEALLRDFMSQTSDPEWLVAHMPGVHELLWAAGYSQTLSVPWWKRVLMWFARIRIESVVTVSDLTPLLALPKNENISP